MVKKGFSAAQRELHRRYDKNRAATYYTIDFSVVFSNAFSGIFSDVFSDIFSDTFSDVFLFDTLHPLYSTLVFLGCLVVVCSPTSYFVRHEIRHFLFVKTCP